MRASIVIAATIVGFIGLLVGQAVIAFRVDRIEGFSSEQLDRQIGDGQQLRVVWIGDSTSAGVGASRPERALPVVIANELNRPVSLHVLSVSGATTQDAVAAQLPKVAALQPDWVFVAIGNNDVTHLTSRAKLRTSLRTLLDGVTQVQPQQIIVLGIAEFGGTPLLPRPLRTLAGWRSHQLDEVVRQEAAAYGAVYVPIAKLTAPGFAADPLGTHAEDRFHPNDAGYQLWVDATLQTLR
jgi:lysophospholipase L1-like esterase